MFSLFKRLFNIEFEDSQIVRTRVSLTKAYLCTGKVPVSFYPVVKILQYADDVVLYLKTSDFDLGKPLLENAVIQVSENLQKIGLKVSPEKTEFVHFNNLGILPGQTEVTINGNL